MRYTNNSDLTGGSQNRRSLAGPRPQPLRWPTVELTEEGAMEEEWPPTPGGRPMVAKQMEEEPEAEGALKARALEDAFGEQAQEPSVG